MNKKIIDIIPPEISEKMDRVEEPSQVIQKVYISEDSGKSSIKKIYFLIPSILLLIFVGVFMIGNFLSKAEIKIWPKTENLTFQTNLTVDKTAKEINTLQKIIPGQFSEIRKTALEEFSSTGNKTKEDKAQGIIRVYNKYHLTQILVANTRFQPALEKFKQELNADEGEDPYFRTVERITIPAKGYKDILVVADSPGEKYNIEPSVFSVPGLAGYPTYTFVYGESSEVMTGGLKEESFVITQEDLDLATKKLVIKAEQEAKNLLRNKTENESILLDEAIKTEILETFSISKPNMEAETFSYRVKVKSTALVFKENDFKSFVKEFIVSQIENEMAIDESRLLIDSSVVSNNMDSGKLILSLNINANVFPVINEDSLAIEMKGKSAREIKLLLESNEGISKVEIKFSPFWVSWVTKISNNKEKTIIKLMFD